MFWELIPKRNNLVTVELNSSSTSQCTLRSNNAANTNGSTSYLNLNNDFSNSNSNISSRLLPLDSEGSKPDL